MIILLTGSRGSGKSTVAMNLATRLSQAGIPAGGIICPGIFDQGRKIGIKSCSPNTGHEEVVGMEITGREGSLTGSPVPRNTGPDTFSYGRWEFRKSALAAADTLIIQDMEIAPFVFIDEIGPLELEHGIGMIQTLSRLDADDDSNNCTKLVCVRNDLIQSLGERWPQAKLVELVEMETEGQDTLAAAIESILEFAGMQNLAGP